MTPAKLVQAILYPFTRSSVLVPVVVLWLLLSFARWGGVLGLFMMFLVLPAVFRFQMILLEARACGREPPPPDVNFFRWFGNAWSLFPVPLVLLAGWGIIAAGATFGTAAMLLALLLASILLPASFAVLAITHAPLQSLNPVALGRLLRECADSFWIASLYTMLATWLMLEAEALSPLLANLVTMLLLASVFSVIGSLIEPYGLMQDVSIPDAVQADDDAVAGELEKSRTDVLTHAYGFVSRGNRAGGIKHITDWIAKDPDVVGAWAWFFERMMNWEQQEHALFFAQHYIHDMLQHGESVSALKVIMRCRLVNEQFRPLREDLPAAIEAARRAGNIELAAVLQRT
jgi:hypothetical protein